MDVAASRASCSPQLAEQLAALDALLTSKSNDKEYCAFLREYRYRVAGGIVDFSCVADLHYALYEEWHLIQSKAPWLCPAPQRGCRIICCHYKKSTEQRPLLEAECRRKGIEFTQKTTRFDLAALIEPELPGFCAKHAAHTPSKRRKRRSSACGSVFMRGKFERMPPKLFGLWALDDTDTAWAQAGAEPAHWTFEYRAKDDSSSFEGFFKLGTTTIVEKTLVFRLNNYKGEEDQIDIEGYGTNQFGTFRMRGQSRQGNLFLQRDYTGECVTTAPGSPKANPQKDAPDTPATPHHST